MTNFEEQYTAWLDGTMSASERGKFEDALPDRAAALRDAAAWQSVRGLLRESIVPTAMPHGDFLNSQVQAAIQKQELPPAGPGRSGFPVLRLAWAGAFLLTLAAVLSVLVVPTIRRGPSSEQFISQVVRTRAGNPDLDAYTFAAPNGKGAVLWVEDAGYIPPDEKIK